MKKVNKKVNLLSVKVVTDNATSEVVQIAIAMHVRYAREIRAYTHIFDTPCISRDIVSAFFEEVRNEFILQHRYGHLDPTAPYIIELYHATHQYNATMDYYLECLEQQLGSPTPHVLGVVRSTFRSLYNRGHYKRYKL